MHGRLRYRFVIIEAVADDEFVFDFEADVIGVDRVSAASFYSREHKL